jgi:hypothetical protein
MRCLETRLELSWFYDCRERGGRVGERLSECLLPCVGGVGGWGGVPEGVAIWMRCLETRWELSWD